MAKYSTGTSYSSGEGDTCEMCGNSDGQLKLTNVAGAKLLVCNSCTSHEDSSKGDSSNGNDNESSNEENVVKSGPEGTGYTINRTDSSWVENSRPQYQKEDTPYLVNQYSNVIMEAIQEEKTSVDEFLDSSDAPKEQIQHLLNNDAFSEGVSRATVELLEKELGIRIIDSE